jgi:hypothetical protein
MDASLALVISVFSLAIATLSYFLPRKPGGSVQWQIDFDPMNSHGQIKHIGSGKARNLVIQTESSVPSEPIERRVSYPQDAYPIYLVRTFGRPSPTVRITWKNVMRGKQERNFEL